MRRTYLTLLALLLGVATAAFAEEPNHASNLLLVVGAVDGSSARVLYDGLTPEARDPARGAITVTLRTAAEPASAVRTYTVTVGEAAQVLVFEDLQPEVAYEAEFGTGGGDVVRFTTLSEYGAGDLRVLAVSCDRFVEDRDDNFTAYMSHDMDGKFDIMFHLGDQIYADKLFDLHQNDPFDEALSLFRQYYRTTWGRLSMSRLLRQGSHWMLPDDHEIMNALSVEMVQRYPDFSAAGLRAMYEYELQLAHDIPAVAERDISVALAKFQPMYYAFTARRTGIFLLDTRWQRSFVHEPHMPLTGVAQVDFLQQSLKDWEADAQVSKVLLVANMPIFYQGEFPALVADWWEEDKYPSHPAFQNNTITVLDALADATNKDVLLVGGDLHMSSEMDVCRAATATKPRKCLRHLVTSGITRTSTTLDRWHLYMYTVLSIKWSTPVVGDWIGIFRSVFLFNNYLTIHAGEADQRFSWRPVWRALSTPQQFRHAIFDWAWVALLAVSAISFAAFARCCCGGRARGSRGHGKQD